MKELVKGEDKAPLETALEDLNKARMKLGEAIYKATAEAGAAGAPGAAGDPSATEQRAAGDAGAKKGGDDVIDAEYEVKK